MISAVKPEVRESLNTIREHGISMSQQLVISYLVSNFVCGSYVEIKIQFQIDAF